jgi:hypothetical protein
METLEPDDILKFINVLNHDVLAHEVFRKCFVRAIKSGEIHGLRKSSLFRMSLAYFLLVSDARERFIRELKTLDEHAVSDDR